MPSIARRIYLASFTLSLVAIVVMVLVLIIANEDLEHVMLSIDLSSKRDFILSQNVSNEFLRWDTASLSAIYIPNAQALEQPLPSIFENIPDNFPARYMEERNVNGNVYLISAENTQQGRLYMARDITLFEDREHLFRLLLFAVGGAIIGLSFLFSIIISRQLTRPLVILSEHIKQTPAGQNMPRLALKYRDRELADIAKTFNHFLSEMEMFVKRERLLISMASHELRTPIAVILGAVEVIEKRGLLQANDAKTLSRIEHSANEMHANISIMLKLSRREVNEELHSVMLSLPAVLEEVLEDLSASYPVFHRVELRHINKEQVFADPVLVKMLMRNLIQNALQHTSSEIFIDIKGGILEISDQGQGLTPKQRAMIVSDIDTKAGQSMLNGLGLYIVTLICERLKWVLAVSNNQVEGAIVRINYSTHAES
jgi:signal transduction histidine kinase